MTAERPRPDLTPEGIAARRAKKGFLSKLLETKPNSASARYSAEVAARRAGNAEMICPHCQTRGHITTSPVKLKKGIRGGKATGAILTGGVSILATGLSRKERATPKAAKGIHDEVRALRQEWRERGIGGSLP